MSHRACQVGSFKISQIPKVILLGEFALKWPQVPYNWHRIAARDYPAQSLEHKPFSG